MINWKVAFANASYSMIARTVTTDDDLPSLRSYSRCVDMTGTFGTEYRKTRIMIYKEKRKHILTNYIFFYNLSPKLPVNRNLTRLIGVTHFELKKHKRLFWRGDVVALKLIYRPWSNS
ncbi:hypothetical protein CPB83DRAFT_113313 [Crepidotus variabilis]|uniref:Uncharacterized protein n=1 Tax=Crepidotus variabilis TaxID=179855 RepID=A0A9P6JIL3_9AGAR|nr:hypothetical protein CPB83DRAFT_113313 [Crepidotus variabilis]